MRADLTGYNATAGAVAGVAAFLASTTFQNQASPLLLLAPGLMALGPGAQQYAAAMTGPGSFLLAPGVQPWPVVNGATSAVGRVGACILCAHRPPCVY